MAINFSDLGGGGGGKALVWKEFLSTSSWTAPSDVTQVHAFVCGGGGGGIRSTSGACDACIGGHGSVNQKILTVVPGQSYTITIGAGGATSVTSSGNGVASSGSATSIGSLFTVDGGSGGSVGDVGLFSYYNSLNETGPIGSGGQGARSASASVGEPSRTPVNSQGVNGKGGGGGAKHEAGGQSPGVDGGGIPWATSQDRTRTLGPDAQANSGAGGASGKGSDVGAGAGGSGYVLLTYSTAE